METTIILARFWGAFMMIVGILVLIRGDVVMKDLLSIGKERSIGMVMGFITMMLGIYMIVIHNVWTMDLAGIVTLIGWIALIKGIMFIGFPDSTEKILKVFKKNSFLIQADLILVTLLGAGLVYFTL